MKMIGKKVVLRDAGMQDHELLQSLIYDPEIVKVTGGYGNAGLWTLRSGRSGYGPVASGGLRKIIADQEEEQTGIGMILLSHVDAENKTAEVYIKLLRAARGRGYGRDAVSVLVSCAFRELGLDHIYASILEYNTASRRLFESCGFQWEHTRKTRADQEGRCKNVCRYSICRECWQESWKVPI